MDERTRRSGQGSPDAERPRRLEFTRVRSSATDHYTWTTERNSHDAQVRSARAAWLVRGSDSRRADDAVRPVDGRRAGVGYPGADGDGAVHHYRAGPAACPYGAAEGSRPGRIHLLQQSHLTQGQGAGREPGGLPGVPLVRRRAPGDRGGHGPRAVAGRERAVLLLEAQGFPDRGVGQQAVDGDRVAGCSRGPRRRTGATLAGARAGPDARLLGRVRPRARRGGVLAGWRIPA